MTPDPRWKGVNKRWWWRGDGLDLGRDCCFVPFHIAGVANPTGEEADDSSEERSGG